MLASKYRLKSKALFARVEIDGKIVQSKSFGMAMYDRKDTDPTRFGFIISTKISKKAVIRNKIKRVMSDHLRINIDDIKKGMDIIFLLKPFVLKLTKPEIEKELNEIITKNL